MISTSTNVRVDHTDDDGPIFIDTPSATVLPTIAIDYDNIAFEHVDKLWFYTLMPCFAVTVRVLMYPLTLLKTRQQVDTGLSFARTELASSGKPVNPSIIASLRGIVEREGVAGLYKGLKVNMITLLVGPVYITTLELTRDSLNHRFTDSGSNVSNKETVDRYVVPAIPFISGMIASFVGQSLAVPLDVIAQRQMILHGTKTLPASTILRQTIATNGVRGLWRGYGLSIMCAAPFSSILWGTFHRTKSMLREKFPAELFPTFISGDQRERNRWTGYERELMIVPIAAATGSTLASIATTPFDVLRTRIQTSQSPLSLKVAFERLIQERGVRGLMSGVNARILGAAPSSALMMSAYELVKRICLNEDKIHR